MVVAIIILASGYPIGGMLGDYLFRRTPRGRVIVAAIGVALGAIFMYVTLNIPIDQKIPFLGMLSITALFIPFASPNVLTTMYDVTVPEVRSTVVALESFIEQGGSAVAPTLAGLIAFNTSLKDAILIICVSTWILCFLFFLGTIYFIPKDVRQLREQLRERAEHDRSFPTGIAAGAFTGRSSSQGLPAASPVFTSKDD
jgi:MFS family permease